MIAQERVEHMAIGLEPIGPPIVAELAPRFLDMRHEPRQHRLIGFLVAELLVNLALGGDESLEQGLRDPAVGLVNLALDRNGMHDREYPRLAEIGALDLDIILEEPLDRAGLAIKRRRRMRRLDYVDLAGRDHGRKRLARTDRFEPEFRRQVEGDLLFAP